THYGEKGVASGVGIKIYDKQGAAINLLPDRMVTGSGSTRGWYAYKDLTTFSGTKENGSIETWHGDFTASLEALSGQTVTVGSVNAQLQAVVSFQ
ncbi:fimbrial protein, partial [Proteus mirabilis]